MPDARLSAPAATTNLHSPRPRVATAGCSRVAWRASALACLACLSTLAAAAPATPVAFLNSARITPPNLPFSEAVRVGNLVFLSGQIGIAPGERKLVPGGIAAEARQTMENIRAVLEANGLAMKDVVKCTVMLADMADWPAFNDIYRTYFAERYPARSALGANGLAFGARVEVECIAATGD